MFPNVRLLIGTLFIAVLVLSCEFGVFAALRVNREPLSRLTAESTSLQLASRDNLQLAVAASRAATHESRAPEADAAPASVALAPVSGGAANTQADQVTAAIRQPAPAAAPVQQATAPPAINAVAAKQQVPPQPPENAAHPESAPGASAGAKAQDVAAAPPPPAAAPAPQAPGPAAIAPAQVQAAQPVQDTPDLQSHQSAAKGSEPAPGAQPAEITGSVPNAATPDPAMPEAAAPHGKTAPKVVHKPAKVVHKPAKIVRKVARTPAQIRHVAKKRVVRRAPAPAATSSAQPDAGFNNPVFQTAPQVQRPAKSRAKAKKAATNDSFGNPFSAQLATH